MKPLSMLLLLLTPVCAFAQAPPIEPYGVPYLQEALNNAQAAYVAGGPGVTEEELVTFHNHLVDTLDLKSDKTPNLADYAKVDQAQVRFLRMNHIRIGIGPHDDLTRVMSPEVAASIEDAIIWNKRFNAGFHQLPGQWTREKHFEQFNIQTYDEVEQKDSGLDKSKEITKALHNKGSLSYEEAGKLLYWMAETFKFSTLDTARIAAAALEGK